jgi:D-alanine-D-alanine ligase
VPVAADFFVREGDGVPQVAHVAVWHGRREVRLEPALAEVAERLGYPTFAKPPNLGSSVGSPKGRDTEDLVDDLGEGPYSTTSC